MLSLARKGCYVVDGILYYKGVDVPDQRRIVVSEHLKQEILDEHHDSPFAGHFAFQRLNELVSISFGMGLGLMCIKSVLRVFHVPV